jgi:peptide/nickel transport system permease protein
VGPSILNVVFIIGFLSWTSVARLVRGQFLLLREQDWVLATRSLGVGDWRIIRAHMLPHVISPVVIAATFGVGGAILTESSLSFLGLGVRPPSSSWGAMLNAAQSIHALSSLPWTWLSPGLAIMFVVLSVNYIGDTLRRALDPYSKF